MLRSTWLCCGRPHRARKYQLLSARLIFGFSLHMRSHVKARATFPRLLLRIKVATYTAVEDGGTGNEACEFARNVSCRILIDFEYLNSKCRRPAASNFATCCLEMRKLRMRLLLRWEEIRIIYLRASSSERAAATVRNQVIENTPKHCAYTTYDKRHPQIRCRDICERFEPRVLIINSQRSVRAKAFSHARRVSGRSRPLSL